MYNNDNHDQTRGGLIGDEGEQLARFLGIAAHEEAATHGIETGEFLAFRGLVQAASAWQLNRGRLAAALADGSDEAIEYAQVIIRPDVDQAATFLRAAVEDMVETWATLAALAAHEAARGEASRA